LLNQPVGFIARREIEWWAEFSSSDSDSPRLKSVDHFAGNSETMLV
jgi:hypothetical protein